MKTISHTVRDPNGIHARPAGILVSTAKKFDSDIKICCGERHGDCKRIFSVMSLSLRSGDRFSLQISGTDEESAAEAMSLAIEDAGI